MEGRGAIIESVATPDRLSMQPLLCRIEFITLPAFTWEERRKRTKIHVRIADILTEVRPQVSGDGAQPASLDQLVVKWKCRLMEELSLRLSALSMSI
jgi:hypothetical protein